MEQQALLIARFVMKSSHHHLTFAADLLLPYNTS